MSHASNVLHMRPIWVVACALAVIGAFFLVLQIAWAFELEPTWLPYPAQLIGAVLAGFALASSSPTKSLREPLIGGVLSVVTLATITIVLPKAFLLTAAQSTQKWVVLPALAATCAVACASGAWLASRAGSSRGAVAVTVAMIAACTIQLGGRVVFALGVAPDQDLLLVFAFAFAFLAGAITQKLVDIESFGWAAAGGAALVLWSIVRRLIVSEQASLDGTASLLLLVTALGAALGARVVWKAR